MFSIMSDFLKGSSDEEVSDNSDITIEPNLVSKEEAEANSPSFKKTKAKPKEIQEYVDIIDTNSYDATGLNRYLLGKQNEGWKQRFPCVSHQRFLIFSWFKIEV